MNTNLIKILVVDDNALVRDMLVFILESSGYTVVTADDGTSAIEKFSSCQDVDIIISDILMPQMNGIKLLKHVRQKGDYPFIVLTGTSDITYAIEALKHGANDYLLKDEHIEDTIIIALDKVVEKKRLQDQNRKLMADLARTNQELKRFVEVQGSSLPTFIIDNNHRITHWNNACSDLTTLSADEMIGTQNQWQALYPNERPVLADLIVDGMPEEILRRYYQDNYQRSLVIEGAFETEEFFPNLGEVGKWLFSTAVPLRDSKGNTIGAIETLQDITPRKQAEKAMRQSEEKYRLLLETSLDPIVQYDLEGNVTYLNTAFTRVFGWGMEELLGKQIDFVPEEERGDTRRVINQILSQGSFFDFETRRMTRNGDILHVSINAAAYRNSDGKVIGMVVNLRDISEKKKAEEELRQLRNYLQNIINSMPSVLVGVDVEGRVTQWNREAVKVTNMTANEAQGRLLTEVYPQLAGEMKRVRESIMDRRPKKNTNVASMVDGEVRFSDVTVYPLVFSGMEGAVIRVDDVSDRVEIEEMMIQSEKMASMGAMAAGMAHEINNPLAAILNNIQEVRDNIFGDLPENASTADECGTNMEIIRNYMDKRNISPIIEATFDSARRAAQIVENTLSFARMDGAADTVVSTHMISDLLDHAVELAQTDYDLKKKFDFRQIEIVRDYDPELPGVPCQANKIQQVFLNILNNGAQAMSEYRADKKEKSVFILRTLKEDEMARIEIEDNGPGMSEAVQKKMFEPFFTTKKAGVGTGLGLSVSYFIVTENHGGTMSVVSIKGKGTKIIIRLPLKRKI